VRPGLIAGPHDPTDRFTYWPRRVARGGDVLAPGRPERPVQLVDVRDLADWCVRLAEHNRAGVFNAVGPRSTLTMSRLLETAPRLRRAAHVSRGCRTRISCGKRQALDRASPLDSGERLAGRRDAAG